MVMLKVLFKTIIFALLLTVLASQVVSAETKLYQYDGKMPFVKMMLTMMVAMGIIDRVPTNGAYGLSGYPGSRWSGYNNLYSRNPYLRALAMRGLSPGSANNPLLRSPWLHSPWTQSALNTPPSPAWGSPSWGVLPLNSYTPYGSRWSSSDLDGWVNEPWETSAWNPEAETATQSPQSNVPLVQNFNYNVPEKTRQNNRSPLRKLMPAERSHGPANRQSAAKAKKPSPLRKKRKQKPCVTEFCGLKKPNLNGLWVAQDGEMLGINNKRYLWTDGGSRYLNGQIKVQNEYLVANVDDHEKLLRFKYKLAGNHLLTLRPDGTISEFVRMPVNRYRNY